MLALQLYVNQLTLTTKVICPQLRAKKVGHQISVSFEKFDVVQALLSFFYTIPADSLKIYFILLFSFSKCPLVLIKVDFDWNFALNKYSLRAYLQSFPTTYNT
jgi:hypothetical protein